jgi:hypothetical protein
MQSPCPRCDNSLVEIHIGEMTLRSCSACDSRWWLQADSPAGIEDVLHSVAENDRGRRRRVADLV